MNDRYLKCAIAIVLLAAGVAAAEEAGDVVVISKADKLPNAKVTDVHLARIGPLLTALPEGHRLRVEFTTAPAAKFSLKEDIRYVSRVTTVNAAGTPDGEEVEYTDWYRRMSRTAAYKNGALDGAEKLCDIETGALTAEIPWVNGKIHGVKRLFHPNGKPASETAYDQGVPQGASRSFDAEGRLTRVVTFAKGQRDGDVTDYWPEKSGQIKQVVPYRKGVVEGVAKAFYRDGKPKWERPFKDNRQHGIEKAFDTGGQIEKTVYWLNGNRVSEAEYREKAGGGK